MSDTERGSEELQGRTLQDQFVELASFEGPDAYWSIQAIYNPEDDTFTIWLFGPDGPKEPLATGVGRWFSYEHEWSDHDACGPPQEDSA